MTSTSKPKSKTSSECLSTINGQFETLVGSISRSSNMTPRERIHGKNLLNFVSFQTFFPRYPQSHHYSAPKIYTTDDSFRLPSIGSPYVAISRLRWVPGKEASRPSQATAKNSVMTLPLPDPQTLREKQRLKSNSPNLKVNR